MAGLYSRVQSRGLPSNVADGLTGAGALASQGRTTDPDHGKTDGGASDQTLTGFQPEGPAPLDATPLLPGFWGAAGGVDQDETPRTHAAPVPGHAGSYAPSDALDEIHVRSAEIHSADFGALTARTAVERVEPVTSQDEYQSRGDNNLAPLTGAARALGRGDVDQGYGFVNGYGFGGAHRDRVTHHAEVVNAYLDPAERPFIVPQARASFQPTDAVQGPDPSGTFWDGSAVNATAPTGYTPAPEAVTAPAQPSGAALPSAGWL